MSVLDEVLAKMNRRYVVVVSEGFDYTVLGRYDDRVEADEHKALEDQRGWGGVVRVLDMYPSRPA